MGSTKPTLAKMALGKPNGSENKTNRQDYKIKIFEKRTEVRDTSIEWEVRVVKMHCKHGWNFLRINSINKGPEQTANIWILEG